MGKLFAGLNFMYWFWLCLGKKGENYSMGDILQGRILIKEIWYPKWFGRYFWWHFQLTFCHYAFLVLLRYSAIFLQKLCFSDNLRVHIPIWGWIMNFPSRHHASVVHGYYVTFSYELYSVSIISCTRVICHVSCSRVCTDAWKIGCNKPKLKVHTFIELYIRQPKMKYICVAQKLQILEFFD